MKYLKRVAFPSLILFGTLSLMISCRQSGDDNIRSFSKTAWSDDSQALFYTSEGVLWKAAFPDLQPTRFLRHNGFTGTPVSLIDRNQLAVQNNNEVWLIDLKGERIGSTVKLADQAGDRQGPVWGIDPLRGSVFFQESDHLWMTISSKGNIAKVKRSPDYFGFNDLMIDEKTVAQEEGIVWIFSPYASPLKWGPGGERLYFISAESGWSKIYSMNRGGSDRRQETIGAGDDRDFTVLSDGTIIFLSNRELAVEWSIWTKKDDNEVHLLYSQKGLIKDVSISPDERWIAFQSSTPTSPFEIFILNRGSGKVFQVTTNSDAELRNRAVTPEVISYKSRNRQVQGILYKPKNVTSLERYPALLRLHGGPSMQDVLMWSKTDQYLAAHGYVVLTINYAGSVGYGKIFEESDLYRIGNEDCDDVARAAEYLKSLPFIEADKIGVMGSSYGGYLTNLVIGKYPGLFSAAVSWFGISDWLTIFNFPRLHPFVRFFFQNRLGPMDQYYELYKSASPLTHADSIRTPLLIIHGDADIVVPIQQSEILYDKMKHSGKNVELIRYKGEGHGWSRKGTSTDAYNRTINWFDRYLQ